MDNLPAPPEGVDSSIEKESEASQPTPEGKRPSPPTHEDHEARRIEAAFAESEERKEEFKQEAHMEGERLAKETKEKPQQPEEEVTQPVTPTGEHKEVPTTPPVTPAAQSGSKLSLPALIHTRKRAQLREGIEPTGAKKAA